MIGSAHTLRRLASGIGLAVLCAAFAIPAAFGKPPVILDGNSSPYIRDAALQAQMQGLDPAIATAINSRRSPLAYSTRGSTGKFHAPVPTSMLLVATPVSSHALSKGSDWGNVVFVFAAIGASFLLVGFGGHASVTRDGRGKRTGSVRAA